MGLGLSDMEPLSCEVTRCLEWMPDRILCGPHREVNISARPTFHVFLDGACTPKDVSHEWTGTSIGGVSVTMKAACYVSLVKCFLMISSHAGVKAFVSSWSKEV